MHPGGLVFLCLSAVMVTALAEQSSQQFRGPRGDGTSLSMHVPVSWNETNNILWKVPLPGRGIFVRTDSALYRVGNRSIVE